MKNRTWKPLLGVTLAVCAWAVAALPLAAAEPLKPAAVIAVAGYDEIKADIAYLGRLSNNPNLDNNLEAILKLFTRNQGLAGLDTTRPWGAVVATDGAGPTGYGFVPVKDLKQLLDVLSPFVGEAKDVGDGVLQLSKGKRPVYVAERNGWAIIADRRETLTASPADPAAAVADLSKQYDVAVRLYTDNLPAGWRQQLTGEIQRGMAREQERRPNEADDAYALRKQAMEEIGKSLVAAINDVDQLTLGWSLDNQSGKTYLDFCLTAKPGSETARQIAALKETKSDFAGFRLPGAALCGNWSGQLPPAKAAVLEAAVAAVRGQAMKDLEQQPKSEEEKKIARELAGDVFDVLQQTVKAGRADGGMALLLDPKAVTFVSGGRLADAARLDRVAKTLADLAKRENPAVGEWIKLDAEQWQSVKFHTVTIPIPPDAKDRDKIVQVLGEKAEMAIGLGKDSLYVAAGRNALATLKQAMEASVRDAAQTVPPLQLSLALGPIARMMAEVGKPNDRPKAAWVAAELAKTANLDHVTLTASPIPDGVRYRVEVEQGLLQLVGRLGAMAAGAK